MGKEEWKNKASVNKSFLGDDEPTEHNRKERGGKRTAEGPRRKSLPLFSFFSSSLFLDLLWTQPYTRRRAKGERRGGFLHLPPPSFFGLSFAPKGGLGYRPPARPPVSPSLPLLLASTFLLPSPATAHPSKRGGGGGRRAARKKRNMSLSLSPPSSSSRVPHPFSRSCLLLPPFLRSREICLPLPSPSLLYPLFLLTPSLTPTDPPTQSRSLPLSIRPLKARVLGMGERRGERVRPCLSPFFPLLRPRPKARPKPTPFPSCSSGGGGGGRGSLPASRRLLRKAGAVSQGTSEKKR